MRLVGFSSPGAARPPRRYRRTRSCSRHRPISSSAPKGAPSRRWSSRVCGSPKGVVNAPSASFTTVASRARALSPRLSSRFSKKDMASLRHTKPMTTRFGAVPPQARRLWNSPGLWKIIWPFFRMDSCRQSGPAPACTATWPLSTYKNSQKSWASPSKA